MKEYKVVYFKNDEECGCDTYIEGATIDEIVKELTYELNLYGKDYDEIAIFDANDELPYIYYYEVVDIYGQYELVGIV